MPVKYPLFALINNSFTKKRLMKAQIAAILFMLSGIGASGQQAALTTDRDNTVYSDLTDTGLKPHIKTVNILGKECNTPYASYDLHYTVEYTGCDQLEIQLDEEYGSSLQTTYVKEAPLANIVTRNIAAAGHAWIDIIAKNQYGEDVYTIELTPCEECYKTPEELKPKITKVSVVSKTSHLPPYESSYDLECVVEYTGCDQLLIQLEEEYSSIVESQIVNEPSPAHVKIESINGSYNAWVDITAQNKYGKDSYTLELPPFPENGDNPTGIGNPLRDAPTTAAIDRMDVYDITGAKVATLRNAAELGSLDSGIYIIRAYDANGNVLQHKYLKR